MEEGGHALSLPDTEDLLRWLHEVQDFPIATEFLCVLVKGMSVRTAHLSGSFR